LVLKLINLRKHHLSVFATVQDDGLADKDIRRFFNTCFTIKEKHIPLLGLIPRYKSMIRPPLVCKLPDCTKNHGLLTLGDNPKHFPYYVTSYQLKHVEPKYTQNKIQLHSRGVTNLPFNPLVAFAYQSAESVGQEAQETYNRVTSKKYKPTDYPMAKQVLPPVAKPDDNSKELAKLPF